MTDFPNEPSPEAPTPEATEAADDWLMSISSYDNTTSLARALDTFAAARVKEAVEKEREEIEWLRRLLCWCRSRLKHASYQVWLEKYLALGPSPVPEDDPAIVQSGEAP